MHIACRNMHIARESIVSNTYLTTSQCSSSNLLVGKKVPLFKLNAISFLTITSKWSIAMMEMFSLLGKYSTLCKPKSPGPS